MSREREPAGRLPEHERHGAGTWAEVLGRLACQNCAAEALRTFRPGPLKERPEVTTPEDAAQLLVPLLGDKDREHCLLLSLDAKHRLISLVTVSIGSVDHTFMSPREIYRDALLHGAAAIMVAHNHPSGDPDPSPDDRVITRRLSQAGTTLNVDFLDHIIVGGEDWVSLAREGVV